MPYFGRPLVVGAALVSILFSLNIWEVHSFVPDNAFEEMYKFSLANGNSEVENCDTVRRSLENCLLKYNDVEYYVQPPRTAKYVTTWDGTWSLYTRNAQEKGYASTVRDDRRVFEKYPVDLRNLPAGTTLGVKRSSDGSVRFYLDGIDKGLAFSNVPKGLHGFVDVANYVTQVSIINQ